MLVLLLYLIAVLLLTLAAFGVAWRVSFGWLGLAIVTFTAFVLEHL